MSFIDRIFKRNNAKATTRPFFARDYMPASSGLFQRDGTSFSCIDRISTEFAQLSYGVYDKRDRQKVKRNPLYNLISQPNLEEDHFLFFYNCAVDYYNGGCFLNVIKDVSGEPVSLFRLNPRAVTITRNAENKRVFNYNGFQYSDKDVLYIPSRFDYSTLKGGMSIFDAVSGTFDTTNKLETYTKASFNNGISGRRLLVDISKALPDATEEQLAILKQQILNEYSGVENVNRPLIKNKGIEYSTIEGNSGSNQAAELAANRELQKRDECMIFGVPYELLSSESAKVTNPENAFMMFNEFAIKPLAIQFQQAFNKLLDEDKYYFEYDFNNVLKVSLASRIDAYNKQINNGLMSPNEARAKENLSPIEAGDTFFIPANLMPLNEETINAYMAKQKAALKQMEGDTSTDEGVLNSQHSPSGDDKQ